MPHTQDKQLAKVMYSDLPTFQVFQTKDFNRNIHKPICELETLGNAIIIKDLLNYQYPGYKFIVLRFLYKGVYRPLDADILRKD